VRILVTRPIEDGERIARRLSRIGHQALLAPLLRVVFLDPVPPELTEVQAVLVSSANGIRALARCVSRRDIAIFAVGPQTAAAARKLGFVRVRNAAGGAVALAEAASRWADPGGGLLLHAAGEESSFALCKTLAAQGFRTRREVLYRLEKAAELPSEAASAIRQGEFEAALFFSPQSAALFAECVVRARIATHRFIAICISASTAQALNGLPFAEIRVASEPNQSALVACL
jgi:uroporphyrinogen-III synthase